MISRTVPKKGKFRDEIGPQNQGFQRLKTLSRN